MPAVANIVLNDTQATPVAHTFVPLGTDVNGVWWFEDQSSASPIGYAKVSVFISRPKPATSGESSAQRMVRVKLGVHTPILENVTNSTVSGVEPAPTIAYVPRANLEFIIPERSAAIDRSNLRAYMLQLLATGDIIDIIEGFKNYF